MTITTVLVLRLSLMGRGPLVSHDRSLEIGNPHVVHISTLDSAGGRRSMFL